DEALKSNQPEIRRLLGVEGNFGEQLGLTKDWVVRIVKQVGIYGEVFERNVGTGSKLGISRGINRLWTKGGIQDAPPDRGIVTDMVRCRPMLTNVMSARRRASSTACRCGEKRLHGRLLDHPPSRMMRATRTGDSRVNRNAACFGPAPGRHLQPAESPRHLLSARLAGGGAVARL